MGEVAQEAYNIQWLVEILINKRMCDELLLYGLTIQSSLTITPRSHVCIDMRLVVSLLSCALQLAKALPILVSKDARISLSWTWLEALYEDFGWMKSACRIFDKKMVEDGLCQMILTLPMVQQQTILLRWFDYFLNKGDDCPNIQKDLRSGGGEHLLGSMQELRITQVCRLLCVIIPHEVALCTITCIDATM